MTLSESLTTERFLGAVLEMRPRVAVFDCDGTLWSGDAGSAFMQYTMGNGLLSAEKVAWLEERYDGYRRGEVSEATICGEMVQVYAGLRESVVREAAATFFREHIEANLFSSLQVLVGKLQEAGVEIWAVSSTNTWVIEEGMKRFHVAAGRVLAARVAMEDDVVTNRLSTVPTDEAKVEALRLVGVTAPDCVFGNSIHDAAMLGIARGAFAVNPTPALAARAAERGWAVYQPSKEAR